MGMKEKRKEMNVLRGELEELNRQELLIDDYIRQMQDMLKDLSEQHDNAQLAYVTHDDIRHLPNFRGETLIAIKAPSGTTLEVPDPDEGMQPPQRRYQIFLKSSGGPIDVYLVSQHDEEDTNSLASLSSGTSPESMKTFKPNTGEESNYGTTKTFLTPPLSSPGCSPVIINRTPTSPPTPLSLTVSASPSTNPMLKLEPPPLQDPDYFFNLEQNEGISDLYPGGSSGCNIGGTSDTDPHESSSDSKTSTGQRRIDSDQSNLTQNCQNTLPCSSLPSKLSVGDPDSRKVASLSPFQSLAVAILPG